MSHIIATIKGAKLHKNKIVEGEIHDDICKRFQGCEKVNIAIRHFLNDEKTLAKSYSGQMYQIEWAD